MADRGTYRVIASELERQIKAGHYAPGTLLPSESSLAGEHSVARNTVRSALDVLEESGLVEVLPGHGRRVVGEPASPGDATTAYERLAAEFRERIAAGEFRSEMPLPGEARLAKQHGVSRNTVRRAYRLLADEGTIVIRHGAGAFVAQPDE
ncbi:regulatory protein, gntR family [Actinopolyspora xinjiangensis]|uniref:Regulatory protein, gntR family n=1 Tax=Actinopolyspora xinjiangensis TaxID=405564 RepID=A0A1H0NR57_9ACTN|nr:regulatory protein, gntR family [Actinopolyspora xinjiangensis]